MTAQELTRTPDPSQARSARPAVGGFTWNTVTDVWWWSDDLYRLYGYPPAAVEPTLERFFQRRNFTTGPDRPRVQPVLAGGRALQLPPRIIDARGIHKTVVAIGFGHRNAADTRTDVMDGFLVEVSTGDDLEAEAALQSLLRSRAPIEQVKGALMLLYGLTAEAAFSVLRGYSQVYNVKIASIVTAVLEAFQTRSEATDVVTRAELDRILWDAARLDRPAALPPTTAPADRAGRSRGQSLTRCSATRIALATIVRVGLTLPFVGCSEESQTTTRLLPHSRP